MTSLSIGKVVLASALSLAGYEKPDVALVDVSEDGASTIVSTLLSGDSRVRFETILDKARVDGVDQVQDLDPAARAELRRIAKEAGDMITLKEPIF